MKNKKLTIVLLSALLLIFCLLVNFYMADIFNMLLMKKPMTFEPNVVLVISRTISNKNALYIAGMICLVEIYAMFSMKSSKDAYKSKLDTITPDIKTPARAGQNQCGSAKWLNKKDFDRTFNYYILDKEDDLIKYLLKNNHKDTNKETNTNMPRDDNNSVNVKETTVREVETPETKYINHGGIVIGKKDISKTKEKIYYIDDDTHLLCIGATRCGKSRTAVMESIATLALAGESIIATDPKGELRDYTVNMLELLGYEVYALDFKSANKSVSYNFLKPIIDEVDKGDISAAIDATWDLTSTLVGESKGEKLWSNGEASTIAACIIAVVYDNREKANHRFRNLTNVYYFISEMCTPVNGILPLNLYKNSLTETHPARGLLAVGDVAPSRTRGSFYTSALMTLRLFTNPNLYQMTNKSDFDLGDIGRKKIALFIILPEDRNTYYPLATLFVAQAYQELSKVADTRGGRLERRVNMVCDEFGNFVKMTSFMQMLTVGGGKGIRFNLFVQDFSQIEKVYEKTGLKTIKNNCETWLYLKATDEETLNSISNKLGKYTINTYSLSSSNASSGGSSGSSVNLSGRNLLFPDEIAKIKRPYSLITTINDPAIMYAPDLSKWTFNEIFGMGDVEHNIRLRMERGALREERKIGTDISLWGIWKLYQQAILEKSKKQEEVNDED